MAAIRALTAVSDLSGAFGGSRDSLGQQVYKAVRLAMFKGEFDPGQLYSETWLADGFKASRTPIREALRQLELEGLIDIIPQRGFRLRVISSAEIREFYEIREMLECSVVSTLCRSASDGALDPSLGLLHSILERQRACINDDAEFVGWDEEFHLRIAELANRPRTARIIASLRGVLWLLGTQIIGNHRRRESVMREHGAIVDALLNHDQEAAVRAMAAHIKETSRLALSVPPMSREATTAVKRRS